MPNPFSRHHRTLIALIATALAVLALAGTWLLADAQGPSDDKQIQQLTQSFAIAVAQEDPNKIMALLCQSEASGLADSDAADDTPVTAPADHYQTTTGAIRIVGDVASAQVTRTQITPTRKTYTTTLYFRKENGMWKVCASARNQIGGQR